MQIRSKRWTKVSTWSSVIFTLFLGIGLFFPIDDSLNAAAIIRPAESVSSVRVPVTGIVGSIVVNEGTVVRAGAILCTIRLPADQQRLSSLQSERIRLLDLEDEYTTLLLALEGENSAMIGMLEAISGFAEQLFSQLRSQDASLSALQQELERKQGLPLLYYITAECEALEFQIAQKEAERTAILSSGKAACQAELLAIQQQLITIKSELDDIAVRRNLGLVRSAIEGQAIEVLEINSGDSIRAGEELCRIIPAGTGILRVKLIINQERLLEIKAGQDFTIRFPELMLSTQEILSGKITHLPADARPNPRNGESGWIYEGVLVNTGSYGNTLRPGLSGTAQVKLGRITIIRYLFREFFT